MSPASAVAADAQKVGKYISVPLFYVTDRAVSENGFNGQRKREHGTSIYNLYFGKLDYTLKNTKKTELSEDVIKLGWKAEQKQTGSGLKNEPIKGSGTKGGFNDFKTALIEATTKADSKDVFLMVHGFNNTHEQAAASGAKLAMSLKKTVIIFDWPSKGKLGQYSVDAGNNEWSQEHFNRLVEVLRDLKEKNGINFNLVAHSMGNRLAIRSAPVLRGSHLFDQIFLVDPDFDAETFFHYMTRYALNQDELEKQFETGADGAPGLQKTKVRILFSQKDNALPLAQFLCGGYTRLGQAADSMLETLFTPSSLSEMVQGAGKFISRD
ncbi:MAG: alpha/beta hydrolase, partial [Candidatus Obscuribacterales bacterium]|nr:alpha/beta hydrolase [Candidatus Obscuribacterales bacterium]